MTERLKKLIQNNKYFDINYKYLRNIEKIWIFSMRFTQIDGYFADIVSANVFCSESDDNYLPNVMTPQLW